MFIWEEVFGPDVWQTLSPSDVAQLAWFANRNISTNYAAFTAFTWVAYDTLLTLGRESQFVWSRRPSAMTAIYVINRYVYIAVCVLDVTQAVFTKDDELQSSGHHNPSLDVPGVHVPSSFHGHTAVRNMGS
ncbi:hypothetical protein PsYK624_136880 [Phanerochaete sordida]|uniref:DUF6533 domain-containing protein n=1 Tax=Phanerochaete sordida TaxID=48140 RepID=A0A9P3LKP7_9APHY|nr:hypothetical protein PsYK624_136880 [Phanerochaete sordida]